MKKFFTSITIALACMLSFSSLAHADRWFALVASVDDFGVGSGPTEESARTAAIIHCRETSTFVCHASRQQSSSVDSWNSQEWPRAYFVKAKCGQDGIPAVGASRHGFSTALGVAARKAGYRKNACWISGQERAW